MLRHTLLNRKILNYITIVIPVFFILLPIGVVSATNNWQEDDLDTRTSIIAKPVDPVYINVDGVTNYIPNHSLPIDIGESWTLEYYLEKDKRYHIFLVGDWICNETDPSTDYDILTYYPDGSDPWWNTESAGIPEQVAFDKHHQYISVYCFQILLLMILKMQL